MTPQYIVAEISKNWTAEGMPCVEGRSINEMFETVINYNLERGYVLHSWRLDRMNDSKGNLNETIIAVFELCSLEAPSHERD